MVHGRTTSAKGPGFWAMGSSLKSLKGKDVENLNIGTSLPIRSTSPPDEMGKPQSLPTTIEEKNEEDK